MLTPTIENPRIVLRDEWLTARKELLAKEKALTRQRDALSAERRALPWVKVEKEYLFDTPTGKVRLVDLFDGRSQLFIKHFMMGPGATTQCVGCSFEVLSISSKGADFERARREKIARPRSMRRERPA